MCRNKHLAYEDRLRYLELPTLSYRRIRGDMIELYKIITGKYDSYCIVCVCIYVEILCMLHY